MQGKAVIYWGAFLFLAFTLGVEKNEQRWVLVFHLERNVCLFGLKVNVVRWRAQAKQRCGSLFLGRWKRLICGVIAFKMRCNEEVEMDVHVFLCQFHESATSWGRTLGLARQMKRGGTARCCLGGKGTAALESSKSSVLALVWPIERANCSVWREISGGVLHL